jgi:hypothetical protein
LLSRKYAKDLILFLNKQEARDNYIEIGCGLGDIIRNVKYKNRFGLDIENEVLRAAKFISMFSFHRKIIYKRFRFPIDQIEGKYNVIVMVNWIHNIEPGILKQKIVEYFYNNLLDNGMIIMDSVNHAGYKYFHKITEITEGLQCGLFRIGEYENNRELWSISKE